MHGIVEENGIFKIRVRKRMEKKVRILIFEDLCIREFFNVNINSRVSLENSPIELQIFMHEIGGRRIFKY